MKYKIEQWLNRVRKTENYNPWIDKNVFHFEFFGDGTGDFEEMSEDCSPEVIKSYMEYCKDQIKLCEEYLTLND